MSRLQTPHELGLSTLFLDLNSYFASVEQNEHPHLRGRPVAVVPMMTNSTCAIAASYEAKAYGIKTGTKIYDAKRMCPHLVCVLANHGLYVDYHHKVLEATQKHIPITKIWSIDEFHCDLIGKEKTPHNAAALAHKIKQQIMMDVGPAIKCSIGIAPNSFLAKVATDMQKPDGLVILHPESLPGRLLDLSLTDLPGINVRMEERLNNAGVKTVEDFWNISPKHARAMWGSVQGERFWYWLHGFNPPNIQTNTCMVGHSRVLDPDLRTPEKARVMTRRLLYKASARLRKTSFCATRLSFSLRFLNGQKWEQDAQFPAARDAFTFMQHFDDLWAAMCAHIFCCAPDKAPNQILCKKVSVILHGLQGQNAITDDLFQTSIGAKKAIQEKRESLSCALEHLNSKYNKDMMSLGIVPKTLAGHIGTKIAFSRVPSKEEFME